MIITPLEYFALMSYILLVSICEILWIYNSCNKKIIKGLIFYTIAGFVNYIFYNKIYDIISLSYNKNHIFLL